MGSRGRGGRSRRGARHPSTRKGLRNGQRYHLRLKRIWLPFRGSTISGLEVYGVESTVEPGARPDLVLIDRSRKKIVIHDLTSSPRTSRLRKRERYLQVLRRLFPGYEVTYEEGYWRNVEHHW